MARVTVTGPNDPCEIHAPECSDLRNRRKFRESTWTIEVSSLHQLAIEIWGDVASDDNEPDSPEWHETCDDYFAGDYRIMPCAPKLPATNEEV